MLPTTPDAPDLPVDQRPRAPAIEIESANSRIHSLEFRAMGCQVSAWVESDDADSARARLNGIWGFFQVVESKLSRFLPKSELSNLNAARGRPVQVSNLMWQVLNVALDAARDTDGLFDPTILPALEAAGYRKTFTEFAGQQPEIMNPPESRPDWRDIILDPVARTVTIPAGARIDLGGVAKSWTAQSAADALASLGPALVDAGGDIASHGSPDGYVGWPIGIADPTDPDSDLTAVYVDGCGVATSGVDHRNWRSGGKPRHHIIDPTTQLPAETDLLTVTVVASDAVRADARATVTMQLGMENGYEHLARLPDVHGLLVRNDRRVATTPGFDRHLFDNSDCLQRLHQ